MGNNYEDFKKEVLKLTGIDLNAYKERQMKRRIDTLIGRNGFTGYVDYTKLISTDAEKLDEFLAAHGSKIDKVLDIAVEKEELMVRLTGRRVCKACGASYHVVNIPPKKEGICDVCGGPLVQRADDNAETVANRIEVYEAQTMPLIEYYEKAGNIAHIDGATGLESVFADIGKDLGE